LKNRRRQVNLAYLPISEDVFLSQDIVLNRCKDNQNDFAIEFIKREPLYHQHYMADTSAASKAHVLEECFVRALSVALSGCESARIAFHRDCGFLLTPYLAERFGEIEMNHVNVLQVVKSTLNAYSQP
jgi:hypothetical protein